MATRAVTGALWSVVVLLALIGAGAALGRSLFVSDFAAHAEPVRARLVGGLISHDPHLARRPAEIQLMDSRFAAHPVLALLHVVPGGVFLLLAPLQFSSRIRRRYVRFHRWSGRTLIAAAFIAGFSAFYFGLLMPYGGFGEAAAVGLFGGVFLIAIGRAFISIRRGQVERHREWMIRAVAVALGISTVRIVGAALDIALTPAGFTVRGIFVLALWIGWAGSVAAAEAWIRHTRSMVREPADVFYELESAGRG